MNITIEVLLAELIDKLTILEIKLEHIAEPNKLINVRHEYDLLTKALWAEPHELAALRAELKSVNAELWKIEDEIRDHERDRNFGETFVNLARSVYRTNDRRAAIKRRINDLFYSAIVEEKSYSQY